MNNKKNIDQLFQDKFKNFEVQPASEVWEAIEAQLGEKKKKRILPIWWKFSGVAALLLIGLLIFNAFYNPIEVTKTPIVQEGNSQKVLPNSSPKKTILVSPKNNYPASQGIVSMDSNEKTNSIVIGNKILPKSNTVIKPIITTKNKWVVNPSNSISYSKKEAILPTQPKHSRRILKIKSSPEDTLSTYNIAENSTIKTVTPVPDDKPTNNALSIKSPNNLDALKNAATSNTIAATQEPTLNDTCQSTSVATNALEELLNEKESKLKQQSKENRWQIASNVAPVFLGSVGNGSPVDPMFENNSKTYNTSFSMGIGLSYALTNTFSIRTGINKMGLSYDTNGIAFFADLENTGMTNIIPSSSGKGIMVENVAAANGSLLPFENAFVHKNQGYINQKIGYYEVPIEITYALLNKRFGLKVIGGLSTFFLNENSIAVISENISTNLGKANNLNEMHFSSNFGIGLKYDLMKSFEFNVEPTIKYQLNTFSANAGNFKPYMIGIYSGISYKF